MTNTSNPRNLAIAPVGGEFAITDLDTGEIIDYRQDRPSAEKALALALAVPAGYGFRLNGSFVTLATTLPSGRPASVDVALPSISFGEMKGAGVNWSALGTVDVADAASYAAFLADAADFAAFADGFVRGAV